MPLTQEEQDQLDALMAKSKEKPKPKEDGGRGPDVRIIIDLSDEKATERAVAYGLLTQSDLIEGKDDGDGDDGDGDGDGDGEKKPVRKRRSYFKDEGDNE